MSKKGIILRFCETAHRPLPCTNINTKFLLRAKCWLRGGVGGQFLRNVKWKKFTHFLILQTPQFIDHTTTPFFKKPPFTVRHSLFHSLSFCRHAAPLERCVTTKKNGCGAWEQTATAFGLQVVPHFTSGIVEWANHASVHENHGPWVDNFRPEDNRNTSLFQAFRRVWGASLNCTPRKRGRGRGEQDTSFPLSPSSLPSFLFLREFFSRALLSEAKEVRWIYLGLENLNLWYQFYNSHSFFNLQSIVQLLMTIIIRCYPTRNIEIQRGRFFFSKKLPLLIVSLNGFIVL